MDKLIYACLYYFSLAYLLIAGIIYVISLLIIFLDKKKRYFNAIEAVPLNRPAQILAAIAAPVIFAAGWIFLFPFTRRK